MVIDSWNAFNQTNVELKPERARPGTATDDTFNQTNVELKLVIESCITS